MEIQKLQKEGKSLEQIKGSELEIENFLQPKAQTFARRNWPTFLLSALIGLVLFSGAFSSREKIIREVPFFEEKGEVLAQTTPSEVVASLDLPLVNNWSGNNSFEGGNFGSNPILWNYFGNATSGQYAG